ncbi:mediator complex, subunit Med5 [Trichophaea hybrida]|nr:mediator complex, subunit Med5 [Trichophaea hybrida]
MPGPAALPLDTYRKLFRKSILTRLPVDKTLTPACRPQFESYFNQLLSRSPIPPTALSSAILEPSLTSNASDPLHLQYISRLVERDIVSLANILVVLFKTSAAKAPAISTSLEPSGSFHHENDELRGRESLEQDVFLVLVNVLRTQKPRSSENVWAAVQAMCDWMDAVRVSWDPGMLGDHGAEGIAEVTDVSTKWRLEALGELVISLGMNEGAAKVLSEPGRKDKKLVFQTCLGLFIQYVQVQNPALASRLEGFRLQYQSQSPRQQRRGLKSEAAGETIDGMMMGLEGDGAEAIGPVAWTRAHLFIWLESLVGALSYSTSGQDANSMVTDFMTAVIDVITNALVRNEPQSTLFLLRSFLCNKVPLILNRISPSSLTSYAISQTFLRTDVTTLMNIAPSIFEPYAYNNNSANPDMLFGDITVDLRQDFLFACALHGVIGEQDIQGILEELPLGAMSASGRYDTQDLITQCLSDPMRIDRLLEEIEGVEGNSGAVVRALFEVMKNMCEQRETMPLRNICSFLARKPSSIDVMLLFIKPAEILEPLCDLLDSWRYEEDQGEYQPVYEEFGYILLLVLTLIHRYSFTSADLAFSHAANNESFVPQLLTQFATAQRIEALNSSDYHAQLGGWIKELFEGEGISDGLMMSCRPQEFYRLVPTLFSQSLLAIQRGILDLETVKEAFAFLLTPFLLPSVISGLCWLSQHLWSNLDSNPYQTLQILSSLVIAHDLAPETAETHRTVLSISAHPLDAVLRELIRRPTLTPSVATTAQQLLTHLKPHLAFKRSGSPTREEIESWVHTAGSGGLTSALANLYTAMFNWSLPGELMSPRPQTTGYTHRLLITAHRLLGAKRVVEIIINETAKFRVAHQAPGVAEDVAAAFLSVFLPEESRGMTLREALRGAEEDGSEFAGEMARRVDAGRRPWIGAPPPMHQEQHVDLDAMGLEVGLEGDAGMELMMGGVEGFGEGMGGMLDAMDM